MVVEENGDKKYIMDVRKEENTIILGVGVDQNFRRFFTPPPPPPPNIYIWRPPTIALYTVFN
jgi:hypothetical protein